MVIKPEPAPVFSVTSSLLQRESWTEPSGATIGPGCQEGTEARARLTLPLTAWHLINCVIRKPVWHAGPQEQGVS